MAGKFSFIVIRKDEKRKKRSTQLKTAGIQASWNSLRQILSAQRRITASLRRRVGRAIHIRKSTTAEPVLMEIYRALKVSPTPGSTNKLIV